MYFYNEMYKVIHIHFSLTTHCLLADTTFCSARQRQRCEIGAQKGPIWNHVTTQMFKLVLLGFQLIQTSSSTIPILKKFYTYIPGLVHRHSDNWECKRFFEAYFHPFGSIPKKNIMQIHKNSTYYMQVNACTQETKITDEICASNRKFINNNNNEYFHTFLGAHFKFISQLFL